MPLILHLNKIQELINKTEFHIMLIMGFNDQNF